VLVREQLQLVRPCLAGEADRLIEEVSMNVMALVFDETAGRSSAVTASARAATRRPPPAMGD
jgi:hypothetical protein